MTIRLSSDSGGADKGSGTRQGHPKDRNPCLVGIQGAGPQALSCSVGTEVLMLPNPHVVDVHARRSEVGLIDRQVENQIHGL